MQRRFKKSILRTRDNLWYIIVIAILAFTSGGTLLYEFYVPDVSENLLQFFQVLDLTIAYIFLTDFLAGMYASPYKNLVYLRRNWLDLLGSIPLHDTFFQALRILRFTRLVRLLRATNTGINIRDGVKRANRKRKNGKV